MRKPGLQLLVSGALVLLFAVVLVMSFREEFRSGVGLSGDAVTKAQEFVVQVGQGGPTTSLGQDGGPAGDVPATLSGYESLAPAVSGAVRDGRFSDAVKAVDAGTKRTTDAAAREFLGQWKGALQRLVGLPSRIAKGLAGVPSGIPCAKLGLEPAEGSVKSCTDAGVEVAVKRATLTQPWRNVTWKAWEILVKESCKDEAPVLLGLLALERGAGEGDIAALDGTDMAPHAAALRTLARSADGRWRLAKARLLAARPEQAAQIAQLLDPIAADDLPPTDRAERERLLADAHAAAPAGTLASVSPPGKPHAETDRPSGDRSATVAGTAPESPKRLHTGPPASFTDKHYVNGEFGFAFLPPSGWAGIPAPKEVNEQFRSHSEFSVVVRYQRRTGAQELVDIVRIADASDLDAAVQRYRTERALGDSAEFSPKPARIGGQPAVTFSHKGPGGSSVTTGVVAAYGEAYVLRFLAVNDKADNDVIESIRSFVFLNDAQRAKLSRTGRGGELPPGWKSFQTPHYDIQYDCEIEFAKELGKHLEAILAEYRKRFPMEFGSGASAERFTVKVFRAQEGFESYASANGVTGAAAYFSPAQNELVCYKTVDQGRRKTFHIIYHEASHQYLHLYMGGNVEIPIWVNEGVAEFFYGGEFTGEGKFRIEENKERILPIKEAIRQGKFVPLDTIFHYTQAQYYADAQLCYAEGWSLAYFFWRTQDARYTSVLDRYYAQLKESKNADAAFAETFGKLDVRALEEAWKKFVLGL